MNALDRNLEAYRLIYEIEVAIREFLIARCEPVSGPTWWKDVLAQAQASKLERSSERRPPPGPSEQRAKDDRKTWMSRRVFHPIYFVDFPELGAAFERNANKELGNHLVSRNAKAIGDHFERLLPIRNAVAHNRPISAEDLGLVKAIHESVRGELGVDAFRSLVDNPSSITAMQSEMLELLGELNDAAGAVAQAQAVQLSVWGRLRQRWWLEPEWQLDAKSVVDVFRALEKYRDVWEQDFLGRVRRMDNWRAANWSEELLARARASLSRERENSQG